MRTLFFTCFVMASLGLGAAAQNNPDDIAVSASISPTTIGMDDHAVLEVAVSGTTQNLPDPILPGLPKFEVYSQGRSSNISIVNGQMSATVTYRYLLLPQEPGTYPIKGIAVVHKNRRYDANDLTLTVTRGGASPKNQLDDPSDANTSTRDYYMEAVVDNRNPYVNEQVTLTLRVHFAVQTYGSLDLTEPTTTGFWTEVLGNKAPYYKRINGRNYKIIERKYAVFPTQTGELTIGRAMLRATVAAQRNRRDPFSVFDMFGSGQEITMRTTPISINVRPLPDKGRPADFSGTIGRFSISAKPNKTQTEINQPVSLTIKISGVGNIKSVAEPDIPEMDEFRVYRASSSEEVTKVNDKIGGTKVFEEVFIPKRPGTLEIPSLSFNYFDPKRQRYETIETQPVTLQVRKPEGYVADQGAPYGGPDVTLGAEASDIRYIKQNLDNLQPKGQILLTNPFYVGVNALAVLALVGTVAFRKRREKLEGDIGYARKRQASRMARKRLEKARSLASMDKSEEFYAEVSRALVSFVADKLNISPHGLTSDSLAEILKERGADQDLVSDTVTFLRDCDFARFAPATVTQDRIGEALSRAESLMARVEGVRFD